MIGDNVSIAHLCSIITFEHTWDNVDVPIKYNPVNYAGVEIGQDVWLGCGAKVLSGAIIGSRVVVAAGSVVKGKCSNFTLYAGAPARAIKSI